MNYLRVLIVTLARLGVRHRRPDEDSVPRPLDGDSDETQAAAVPVDEQSWKRELATQLAFTRSILALGSACPDNPYGRMASVFPLKVSSGAETLDRSPQPVAANPES